MVIKLMSRKFSRSTSKLHNNNNNNGILRSASVEWELRPGGLLVQRRDMARSGEEEAAIRVRIPIGPTEWHMVSIDWTSTFGDLKATVAAVTGLEPEEQRMLFRGKERGDDEHLHMVGVRDMDKVVVMEDPAIKERKMRALLQGGGAPPSRCFSAIRV